MSQNGQASDRTDSSSLPYASSRSLWLILLVLLGCITTATYGWLNSLSWGFTYKSIFVERPIIQVLLLFSAAFLIYLAAIFIAKRAAQTGMLIGVIIGFALLFRVVMLFSYPIQEVDIYRYMWDGEVQTQGVSPFKFSPAEALAANALTKDPELKKLVAHRDSDPAVAAVLQRVHYGHLPTIYPPTSQLVFRAASMISPSGAWAVETDDPELQRKQIEQAVNHRLWVMKAVLIAFDLGVLILLIKMSALCRMPVGLSVAYGWCPLVMKEVANSGHLDAIAVFLSVLAIYLLVRLVSLPASDIAQDRSSPGSYPIAVLAGLVLAAAVGAKLYPIVLAPLVFGGILRRCSWLASTGAAIAFTAATFLLLQPILPSTQSKSDELRAAAAAKATDGTQVSAATTDPSDGVTTFLKYWEMNDFIFMIVVENLKVDAAEPPIWFSVAPQAPRQWAMGTVANVFDIPTKEAAFMTTRALTSFLFLLLALWFAWRAGVKAGASDGLANGRFYCEAAFLSMAWFWLLLPTQNPWYWLWALPFLPFMRNRAWFAVSGIIIVYYFRFWMEYHWTGLSVWGTPYQGVAFYDFVLTWFEFAPWFIWLAVEWFVRGRYEERGIAQSTHAT